MLVHSKDTFVLDETIAVINPGDRAHSAEFWISRDNPLCLFFLVQLLKDSDSSLTKTPAAAIIPMVTDRTFH